MFGKVIFAGLVIFGALQLLRPGIPTKAAAGQKATRYEAVNMIQLGAMPLPTSLSCIRKRR